MLKIQHHTGSLLTVSYLRLIRSFDRIESNWFVFFSAWNEDWGDKGFFKIARGNDECGIEDGIVAGLPKLD